MRISYNRLWKLLIDKNLKKKDLMERWPRCTMWMFVQSMSILRRFMPTQSLRKMQLSGISG